MKIISTFASAFKEKQCQGNSFEVVFGEQSDDFFVFC